MKRVAVRQRPIHVEQDTLDGGWQRRELLRSPILGGYRTAAAAADAAAHDVGRRQQSHGRTEERGGDFTQHS